MAKKRLPKKQLTEKDIDRIITNNLDALKKSGVLTVRPGFEIAGHQLTGKPAIVVTVHTKKKDLPRADLLPESIQRVPVDVREASAHQRLRAFDPAAAALTQTFGRPEDKEPLWPLEREMPSGKLLNSESSHTERLRSKDLAMRSFTANALRSHTKKEKIDYVPANASLETVTVKAAITAHVSPDAGLKTLQSFLAASQKSLVIGMYDFTSARILASVESALQRSGTLTMVLDNPPQTTEGPDQSDTAAVEQLTQVLGPRAKIARALERQDVFASAWIFPYAYHIKVVVRDSSALWLSSGNFNNSNQPDLSSPPPKEDRDWHVIIENDALAKTFEAYLLQDFETASQHQIASPQAERDTIHSAFLKLANEHNPTQLASAILAASSAEPTQPQRFELDEVTITPLLTPDKENGNGGPGQYLTQITDLISKATTSIHIQLQYIESSKGGTEYDALLQAIADQANKGIEVQLIENSRYGEKWAEKMKSTGVDLTANIWMQPNVHNKGFVIDSEIVVISSQNFSLAGVRDNRDAGVIIRNKDVAQYYEKVFASDLNTKARKFDPNTNRGARVRTPRPRLPSRKSRK